MASTAYVYRAPLVWSTIWSRAVRLDLYVAAVVVAAVVLFGLFLGNSTREPWNVWAVGALFVAMVVAERLSIPLPQNAMVSIATIPHLMAVLLLPPWLTMVLASGSMLADQLAARTGTRRVLFNTASIGLTTGVAALVADQVGLTRENLASSDWRQVLAFLAVAGTYYCTTNLLVAAVVSLSTGAPITRIFLSNARFVLPAEFAVCGMGGIISVVWVLSPAWAPLVLFPAVISQVALMYVASSKRNHARISFLAEASRVLSLSLDEQELATSSVQLAVPELADVALVYLQREDGTTSIAARAEADSAMGGARDRLQHAASIESAADRVMQQVLERGCTTVMPDLRAFGLLLQARGHVLGVLVLITTTERSDAKANIEIAEELARRCGIALDNARLHAEAQKATRLRDEFLSIAAHELRTPVTSLRGYAQLLSRLGDASDRGVLNRGLRTIDSQADRLSKLMDRLLDISRIESGKVQLDPEDVDLAQLVPSVATATQDITGRDLQVSVDGDCSIMADPVQIEQVVRNLIDNAIKFSPLGGPIEITLSGSRSAGVRLEVRDHGVGIPVERRAQLFSRFYQAHGEGYLSGLGLGLYISSQIVELHGGQIEAEFPADGGTRFVVTLPAKG